MLSLVLSISLAACSSDESKNTSSTDVTVEETAFGYGGEVKLSVQFDGDQITDITILDHAETGVLADRAFPIIIERIIEANSPVVDSVTSATFTSYAVKKAVSSAMVTAGLDCPEITMTTSGPEKEAKTLEDVATDIVIVGGGPAGLAAAIGAKQTNPNVNVILLEKLDILSGNGKFDMNFFDMIQSQAQAERGMNITAEDFKNFKSTPTQTETEERLQVWSNGAAELDSWLRDFGVELNFSYGGDTSTSHMAESNQYAGEVIQAGLEKEAIRLGVDIRTGSKGGELIFDNDKVIGVNVTNNNNESYKVLANATILATGGFSHNPEMVKEYADSDRPAYVTSNAMGATGDYVKLFEEYGFQMENMNVFSTFTNILSPRRDLTGGADVTIRVDAEGNPLGQSPEKAFLITDQEGHDSFYRMQKHSAAGYYTIATSLEELATKLEINYEGLMNTINEYNENVENQVEGFENKRALSTEGTFYGAAVVTATHMTKGGVKANEQAQVLNTDGEVVDGLYAAGEVTSQTGAYSASVVFGKIAGVEAALAIAE